MHITSRATRTRRKERERKEKRLLLHLRRFPLLHLLALNPHPPLLQDLLCSSVAIHQSPSHTDSVLLESSSSHHHTQHTQTTPKKTKHRKNAQKNKAKTETTPNVRFRTNNPPNKPLFDLPEVRPSTVWGYPLALCSKGRHAFAQH